MNIQGTDIELVTSYKYMGVLQLAPRIPVWPGAGGGTEKDDGEAVFSDGQPVQPPAGHHHSTGQPLQGQNDSPSASEGEVSQVVSSCSSKTVQPALLPVKTTFTNIMDCTLTTVQYSVCYIHLSVQYQLFMCNPFTTYSHNAYIFFCL